MVAHNDKPILFFATANEWDDWLATAEMPGGVRLRLRKKASTKPGFLYAEALDAALCHGWIDGQIQSEDSDYYLQAFTPRRARSPWSKINRDHVSRLILEGRMRLAGQAEIDRAKSDGRWDAAYQQKGSAVPADLQAALDANASAAATFASLTNQERFAFVFRLGNVKREQTRIRKVAEYVTKLANGQRTPERGGVVAPRMPLGERIDAITPAVSAHDLLQRAAEPLAPKGEAAGR